jgi:dTDP-4-dehydrorhamnose 3,5-epimerase
MELSIPDVRLLTPRRFGDHRGWFTETWSRRTLDIAFCQDNMSLSAEVGTIRGLHIRRASPTFGQHVAVELSATAGNQLLIPRGFAHGFCTLEPGTQVMYKVDDFYAPESDAGIFWADPDLAINWPVRVDQAHLSPKDLGLPRLKDIESPF